MTSQTPRAARKAVPHRLTAAAIAAVAALGSISAHAGEYEDGFGYFGGGARIAEPGLAGFAVTSKNPVFFPGYAVGGEVSAFGFFLNQILPAPARFSFCGSLSSGFGKAVFDGSDASKPCSPTGYYSELGKAGFGAKKKFADFATTDSPLKGFELATYLNNAKKPGTPVYGRGRPVQLPAVISSVGIAYNNPDLPARLDIGSQTLCQIFAGEVTDWNQIDDTLPSRPIKVVVRGDNNATNFAITNYFNSVCTGIGETYGVSETFAAALPSPLPDGASTANFVSAPTNAAVSKLVGNVPGAIGYIDATSGFQLSGSAQLALVESLDPIVNLPEAASYVSSFPLLTDTAIGASVPNGRPILDTLRGGTNPGCLLLVDPAASGFAAGGYPIVNIAYLLFSTQGNGSKAATLSKLGSFLTDAASFPDPAVTTPRVTTIDLPSDEPSTGKTGYAAFAPGSTAALSIQAAAQSCIGQ